MVSQAETRLRFSQFSSPDRCDMNARDKRIQEDLRRLGQLADEYPSVICVAESNGNPVSALVLRIDLPTPASRDYPSTVQPSSTIHIDLPARYPFDAPKVTILTPIWNPNVYPSGLVCLGLKWLPTQGLDLLVLRVMQLLTLDPTIVNTDSPANAEASRWYIQTRTRYPDRFPTTSLRSHKKTEAAPRLVWRNLNA